MARHSRLRIGGAADVWMMVQTRDELAGALRLAVEHGSEVTLMGLGSNTLFSDEGVRGLVLQLSGEFSEARCLSEVSALSEHDEVLVDVGAGKLNAHLVKEMLRHGLVDMEYLELIPGMFGGSVVMNAGTKEWELSEILREVTILVPTRASGPGSIRENSRERAPGRESDREEVDSRTRTSGSWCGHGFEERTLSTDELQMSYRHTSLPKGAIVISGRIALRVGDVNKAQARARRDKERRNQTQPYKARSVGSTFANPPGDYAGRLIEQMGLKGRQIGGARISELHANFFVNEDNATAEDFLKLMALARVRVREQFGVELRPEVQFVGFDGETCLRAFEREWMQRNA